MGRVAEARRSARRSGPSISTLDGNTTREQNQKKTGAQMGFRTRSLTGNDNAAGSWACDDPSLTPFIIRDQQRHQGRVR